MSRFADTTKHARLKLGPCECPGKPHAEGDWMDLRTEVGAADIAKIALGPTDALEALLVDWNLLDDDAKPAPPDREHIDALWGDILPTITRWTRENVRATRLPNEFAAPSPTTSQESGSPTRKPKTEN